MKRQTGMARRTIGMTPTVILAIGMFQETSVLVETEPKFTGSVRRSWVVVMW